MKKITLSKSMTTTQFENGYWYAEEIKDFAETIGIPSAHKMRKDELEKAILIFLKTSKIKIPTTRNLSKSGVRDFELGLYLKLPIINYTSNKETKNFILKEALKIVPNLKRKSGVNYRLNRWREEQLTRGVKITYEDLVKHYIKLNQTEGHFAQVPVGRYINFLSDFMKYEKGMSKEDALRAWHELKKLDIPKNYKEWKKYTSKK